MCCRGTASPGGHRSGEVTPQGGCRRSPSNSRQRSKPPHTVVDSLSICIKGKTGGGQQIIATPNPYLSSSSASKHQSQAQCQVV